MGDVASLILPLSALALVFWLFILRPQVRRGRELDTMQQSLSVGDQIMLTSGIHGTISGLEDDVAQVEIAPGTVITVARGAIGRTLSELPKLPKHPEHPEHPVQQAEEEND